MYLLTTVKCKPRQTKKNNFCDNTMHVTSAYRKDLHAFLVKHIDLSLSFSLLSHKFLVLFCLFIFICLGYLFQTYGINQISAEQLEQYVSVFR